MDLKDKLKEQYVTYREILKEKDLVKDVKDSVPFIKDEKAAGASKENTRKWHAKLY